MAKSSNNGDGEDTKQVKPRKLKSFLPITLSDDLKKMEVSNLQVDSRKVQPGDLFMAYPGVHSDGRQFAQQAVAAGARCVLAETASNSEQKAWLKDLNCPLLEMDGLVEAVGDIASSFYGHPSQQLDVIAVTGTNGKTSVTQLVAQALVALGDKAAVVGTLGNGFPGELVDTANTTPGALELQAALHEYKKQGASVVAMEASSHGLEQGRLQGTAINIAAVTNLSRDHLDYHGSMKAYQKAKEILVRWQGLQHVVLNADDERVMAMKKRVADNVNVMTFSLLDSSADIFADQITFSGQGVEFWLHYAGESVAISTPLVGEFNIANVLVVCGVLIAKGYGLKEIRKAAATLLPIHGRMELVSIAEDEAVQVSSKSLPTIVVDYAHTPDALDKALTTLRKHCEGELWCVFGCGGDRDEGKRPLMGEVVSRIADRIVLTNDNPRTEKPETILKAVESGFELDADYYVQKDRKAAIADAVMRAAAKDWVLVAGKGHEDYQEIDGVKHPFSDIKVARKALMKRFSDPESLCD
ncbi:MAG: UDP-N-acetylmuramoyl-L-alanyl-D-glutamate--2,6-diaminopimelate ligase [Pseudomonadales bacterium]|nr:UDP-N-acetylmuramoyl-L-alanyl-D-glutamate--2,6-diaminopimelate ligase [Pseudomonadales bacterium]